jgi:hypothetical protein
MSYAPLAECDDAVILSFLHLADLCQGAPFRIRKSGEKFSYGYVHSSELDEWTRSQRGGFRKYALNISQWEKRDRQRAYSFLGKVETTFYINVTSDYIQVFPSSI